MRFIVDRRAGKLLVLEDAAGKPINVPAAELPENCRSEGAVLDVPTDEKGNPVWSRAQRNRAEEDRLRHEAENALERLRRTDPGGDVEL